MEWDNECKFKMDYSIDLINSYGDVWLQLFKESLKIWYW
jgi:hypothetical protein